MRNFRLAAAVFAVVATFVQVSVVQSAIITVADYQDDFQGPTPAAGWSYRTNSLGAIGNAANYTNLISRPDGLQYNLTGSPTLPVGASYASMSKTGGHPGLGTTQGSAVDRYVIAAYTIQAADVADYVIESPFMLTGTTIFRANANAGESLALRVYVNNTLIGAAQTVPGATVTTFNRTLGDLVVGDTVYVAVGPNVSHSNDSYSQFNFTIQFEGFIPPAPEPTSAVLLGLGMVGLLQTRRRARCRK